MLHRWMTTVTDSSGHIPIMYGPANTKLPAMARICGGARVAALVELGKLHCQSQGHAWHACTHNISQSPFQGKLHCQSQGHAWHACTHNISLSPFQAIHPLHNISQSPFQAIHPLHGRWYVHIERMATNEMGACCHEKRPSSPEKTQNLCPQMHSTHGDCVMQRAYHVSTHVA
jgi:hypothetical protein